MSDSNAGCKNTQDADERRQRRVEANRKRRAAKRATADSVEQAAQREKNRIAKQKQRQSELFRAKEAAAMQKLRQSEHYRAREAAAKQKLRQSDDFKARAAAAKRQSRTPAQKRKEAERLAQRRAAEPASKRAHRQEAAKARKRKREEKTREERAVRRKLELHVRQKLKANTDVLFEGPTRPSREPQRQERQRQSLKRQRDVDPNSMEHNCKRQRSSTAEQYWQEPYKFGDLSRQPWVVTALESTIINSMKCVRQTNGRLQLIEAKLAAAIRGQHSANRQMFDIASHLKDLV